MIIKDTPTDELLELREQLAVQAQIFDGHSQAARFARIKIGAIDVTLAEREEEKEK